jgi:hypothetical protein
MKTIRRLVTIPLATDDAVGRQEVIQCTVVELTVSFVRLAAVVEIGDLFSTRETTLSSATIGGWVLGIKHWGPKKKSSPGYTVQVVQSDRSSMSATYRQGWQATI